MINKALIAKISAPYARALLELAKSKNNTDKMANDIGDLVVLFSAVPELLNYLKNPIIDSENKKSLMREIIASLMHEDTINFIQFLIDRRRIEYFDVIAEKFLSLVWKHIGLVVVTYQTAVPLTIYQELDLSQNLQKLIGSKQIQLVRELDRNIIGGLILQFDSKVIDMSLRGELRKIANILDANVNFDINYSY